MRINLERLDAALAAKLAPGYFVTGDETLLVEETCDLILEAARRQGFEERTVIHADGHYRWADLRSESASMSLFASRRVLDVRVAGNKFDREASEALRAYADKPPDETLLLLRSAGLDGRQRSAAWYKALDQFGAIVTIWPVKPASMPQWLRQRADREGLAFTSAALDYLSERVEGNLLAAAQQLQKLALLQLPAPIDVPELLNAIDDASHYQVFDITDAVYAGEARRVVRGVASLRAEGVSVFGLLGALRYQLLNLTGRGNRVSEPQQRQFSALRRRVPDFDGAAVLAELALIDAQAKGQLPGDAWESLERTLLRMAGIEKLQTLEALRVNLV